jgi:pyruvate/2-oxoglutarate dehydrogenase complex dihydrolipoamide dehydrogenase (E3) component
LALPGLPAANLREEGSAHAAYLARRASDYGVTIGGPVGDDMQAVKARKDAVVAPSRRGVERSLRKLEGSPLGRVGMTEAEVRKTGKPELIATLAMEDVSRAYEKGEIKGFMKILVDRDSKQILGASLLGLAGDEVIHCILDLMYAKAPYTVMQRAMHIHPRCRNSFRP